MKISAGSGTRTHKPLAEQRILSLTAARLGLILWGLLEVGAAQAKTKMRRLVDIEPALDGILGATERVSGPVAPIGYRDLIERAQAVGGWRDERGRSTWPANCLRHGFVSYHLSLYNDAARTELQAGHDRAVMFRNYRELVTREAAEEFWSASLCF